MSMGVCVWHTVSSRWYSTAGVCFFSKYVITFDFHEEMQSSFIRPLSADNDKGGGASMII